MKTEIAEPGVQPAVTPAGTLPVTASVSVLLIYDVCEEIDLASLRRDLGEAASPRAQAFPYPMPEYVRFERPPITQPLPPRQTSTGQTINAVAAYYDYGVISVQLQFRFSGSWPALVRIIARSIDVPELKAIGDAILRDCMERARPSLIREYGRSLDEDYCVVHVDSAPQTAGSMTAELLLKEHRTEIAQIVRSDATPLSPQELKDALDASMSYSPFDVVVAGWNSAFVYDTAEGFAHVLQLIEYANTQLLEFRRYDEVLTGVLGEVYRTMQKRTGLVHHWRLAREAARLNTIRLEVLELTERMDNSIKFFGEIYSARLYRLAASKVGVPDYRALVDGKLRTAYEQYLFMVEQFHQSRAFVMELIIVVILIIDLVFLFRGRT